MAHGPFRRTAACGFAGKPHRVRMQGVSTRSLYIEPAAAPGRPLRGAGYFPLLHQLLLASADMPALYDEDGRDGALAQLLLHEVRQAQTMPCSRRSPRPPACTAVQGIPEVAQHPGHAPGMGAATAQEPAHLHALLSPADGYEFWGMAAVSLPAGGAARLSAGQSVTQVALDLGYDSPSAFSSMFKRRLGKTPMEFICESDTAASR